MKNKIILVVVCVVVIASVVFASYWFWSKNKLTETHAQTLVPEQPTQNNNPTEDAYFLPPSIPLADQSLTPTPNTNVQWNSQPTKLSDLKLILGYAGGVEPLSPGQPYNYYELGNHGANKIILSVVPAVDPSGPVIIFFEQSPAGYILMEKMSPYNPFYNLETKAGYALSKKVISADTTTYYKGVVGPGNFIYNGIKLENQYLSPSDLFSNYISDPTISKISTTAFGDLYLHQQLYQPSTATNSTANFYLKRYILKLPSGLYTNYNIKYSFFSDNMVPDITWNNGTKNQDTYQQDAHMSGCGNPGGYVVSTTDVSNLVQQTGTTSTSDAIYEFKDINNNIVKFFYDLSGGSMYNQDSGKMETIPFDQWYTHHPVVLYKNAIGEYVIFTNDKYGLQAECGKPVIYLYPTQPTNVKVQVGADISKSEPLYSNGWNIMANPDGSLKTADGKIYNSLFWEGTGYGVYPEINKGFIVRQTEIKNTIKVQLKQLGLSEKETTDFLDFWMPKMPNTPYTRLTWFTTEQMNNLAPLFISPKPDTIIRIFLDFQGLNNNIKISSQQLTSLSRKGFTVVEWGGILRK